MTKPMMNGAAFTLIAACTLFIGGCASSGQDSVKPAQREQASATHYWESTASSREYKVDNAACAQKTEVDADGKLNPNSTTFDAYRDCMIEQGYTLRNY